MGYGVSQYVSTVVLIAIVLGLSVVVYANFRESLLLTSDVVGGGLARVERFLKSSLLLNAAYVRGGRELILILSGSSTPVKILSIYINNTIYVDRCVLSGNVVGDGELKPYGVAVVKCYVGDLPEGLLYVRITYEGGVLEAYVVKAG